MPLELTGRPDREGAAAYFISDGSSQSDQSCRQIAEAVDATLLDEIQVVQLDGTRGEGSEVVDFYDVPSLPAVMIVMDDDQIFHSWFGQLPTAEDVVYMMAQSGVRMRGDQ